MEFGIVILVILASFILRGRNKGDSSHDGPKETSEPMTWEEMENHYGISLSYEEEDKEPEPVVYQRVEETTYVEAAMDNLSYGEMPNTISFLPGDTVMERKIDRPKNYESPVDYTVPKGKRSSVQAAARQGLIWSLVLGEPKGIQRMKRR